MSQQTPEQALATLAAVVNHLGMAIHILLNGGLSEAEKRDVAQALETLRVNAQPKEAESVEEQGQ